MKINILTLFPEMFNEFLRTSIIKRSIEKSLVEVNIINIRDFAKGKHKQVDDTPYGGCGGMVLKVEPIFEALNSLNKTGKTIYMSPHGKIFDQEKAKQLSTENDLTIISGHYEGIDARAVENLVDEEVSIGDFVLTGGELPSMIIVDTITRMIDGVIKKESYETDSHFNGLLGYAQYTKPDIFNKWQVPETLKNGNHKEIKKWRLKNSLKNTLEKRPDLLKKRELTDEEKEIFDLVLKEKNGE